MDRLKATAPEGQQEEELPAWVVVRPKLEHRRCKMSAYKSLKKSTVSSKYLSSNATSHSWPFGAIAELIGTQWQSQPVWVAEVAPLFSDSRVGVGSDG